MARVANSRGRSKQPRATQGRRIALQGGPWNDEALYLTEPHTTMFFSVWRTTGMGTREKVTGRYVRGSWQSLTDFKRTQRAYRLSTEEVL